MGLQTGLRTKAMLLGVACGWNPDFLEREQARNSSLRLKCAKNAALTEATLSSTVAEVARAHSFGRTLDARRLSVAQALSWRAVLACAQAGGVDRVSSVQVSARENPSPSVSVHSLAGAAAGCLSAGFGAELERCLSDSCYANEAQI